MVLLALDDRGILPLLAILIVTTVGAALILLWVLPFPPQQPVASPAINNATIINNYYCNTTEPISEVITVYGDKTESIMITETQTPSPTPTYWNDTRRESVGLPVDRNRCCHPPCTPTPTPTGTPVPEFPCPLRSGC